ncbi:MAG: hypothetical protein ACOC2D_12530 [Spirochaetota bacterium]
MRLSIATTLLLALVPIAVGPPAFAADGRAEEGSDDDPGASLLAEVIRRTEFDDLAAHLGAGALPLAASPAQVARALFDPWSRLPPREREALLLLLLRTSEDPNERRELARTLFARLEELSDWSLLALLFEEGLRTEAGSIEAALDAAGRVLAALEEPSPRRAGYERLAIAVAAHARAVAPVSNGPTAGATLPLAETLRSIARLSRSEAVVEAARTSARALLDLSARRE